jgi:hypothetical protein
MGKFDHEQNSLQLCRPSAITVRVTSMRDTISPRCCGRVRRWRSCKCAISCERPIGRALNFSNLSAPRSLFALIPWFAEPKSRSNSRDAYQE